MRRRMTLAASWSLAAAVVLGLALPAAAHEQRRMGEHVFDVGWLEEPLYAGFMNAVFFGVSHGEEPAAGRFQVEVIFGKRNSDVRTEPLRLQPIFGRPGEYKAPLIPTRPGTYTFHIFGTLEDGDEVDQYFTSGERTFDEVRDPSGAQFPEQDPTSGELAGRLERIDARLASVQESATAAADSAGNASDTARTLAIVGIALGALALALVGLALLIRPRRRAA